MILTSLKIYNFRLFLNKKIEFAPSLNIITGLNASGKTTVLESVYYLSVTKSFREVQDCDLISLNYEEMSVIGEVETTRERKKVRASRSLNGKSVYKNETKYRKISDYLGEVLTVAFSNSDLIGLVGSPKDRRKIFEPIICQISNFYVDECNCYKKILNERNALLKRLIFENSKALSDLLCVVTNQLVDSAKKIISIRVDFVKKLNEKLNAIHNKICGCSENVCVKYLPSVEGERMLEMLEQNVGTDIKKGSTSYGPHRDDFGFYINGKNVVTQGSQGQQRNILIAVKIAFVDIIKKTKEEEPILLLDDVFSELDKVRQNNLLQVINCETQTIISTATLAEIDNKLLEKANIITLKKEEKENG